MAASVSRMWCLVFSSTGGGRSRAAAAEMYSDSARLTGETAASDWTFMSAHDMDAIRHSALARAPVTIARVAARRRDKRRSPLAGDKPLAGQAAIVTGRRRRLGRGPPRPPGH